MTAGELTQPDADHGAWSVLGWQVSTVPPLGAAVLVRLPEAVGVQIRSLCIPAATDQRIRPAHSPGGGLPSAPDIWCSSWWSGKTLGVDFVSGAFATWLVEQIADAGRSKLITFLLGTEQQRALRPAATTAIGLTAEQFASPNAARVEQLAMVIDQVFTTHMPKVSGQHSLLEALYAGIARQLAPLDDAGLTGTGMSSAEVLGVRATDVAQELTEYLVQEIMSRGSEGGALAPLANQLDHDVTHLAARRVEAKLDQLTRALELWMEQRPRQQGGLRTRTRMHDQHGQIGRVREYIDADAVALGVHPAIHYRDSPQALGSLPTYVRRDVEGLEQGEAAEKIDAAFTLGGLMIIEGASASGKTRTALEMMRRLCPDRWLIVPDNPASPRELKDDGIRLSNAVVWLDDIDDYIAAGGLDAAVLDAFCPSGVSDVLLLATLRSEARNRLVEAKDLEQKPTPASRAAKEIFARARVVLLDRGLTHSELQRADALRTVDPRIGAVLDQETGAGFAEYMAAAPAILQRWESARRGQNPTAGAVIRAAVDARLVGLRTPLSASMLEDLHVCSGLLT